METARVTTVAEPKTEQPYRTEPDVERQVVSNPQQVTGEAQPPDYCLRSILSFVCCCWPIAAVALYFGWQVQDKYGKNDIHGAWRASNNAKKMSIASIGCGCSVVLIMIIVIAASAASAKAAVDSAAGNQYQYFDDDIFNNNSGNN